MRIRRYIQGHRSGREANRIERQAMRDPFLAEALEGYEGTKENPIPQINLLRQRIRSRNQRRLDVFKYGGMIASLLFILVFGLYFGFQRNSLSEPVIGLEAYHTYIEENKVPPTDECKEIKGKVSLSFLIDPSGKPYDIRVEAPLCPSTDKEAIRLIQEGPLWQPTEKRIGYTVSFD